jgi:hypothetical protein
MNRNKAIIAASVLAALCSPAWAVNKCTLNDGRVVYQDTVCAATSKTSQSVKTWDAPIADRQVPTNPDENIKGPAQAKPLLDLYRRWADAEKLALATGRIALSGPIATMQAIQREAEAMTSPACLDAARKLLVELTQKSSKGLLEFMGKTGLDGMVYTIVDRRKLVPAFEAAIKKSKCESPDSKLQG